MVVMPSVRRSQPYPEAERALSVMARYSRRQRGKRETFARKASPAAGSPNPEMVPPEASTRQRAEYEITMELTRYLGLTKIEQRTYRHHDSQIVSPEKARQRSSRLRTVEEPRAEEEAIGMQKMVERNVPCACEEGKDT